MPKTTAMERRIARKIDRVIYRSQRYPHQLSEDEKLILVQVAKEAMKDEEEKQA